jgi:acetoin utilization deacetylase AcuC-like enzyme
LVAKHEFTNSFAIVRPPGHHATRFYGLGFCIFNNVAVAAKHLLQNFKLKRVLIFDIDSHHGNGTQEVFYRTDKVLYTSLHENPRDFPGTGFTKEVGEDQGTGYTVNIPLPFGTTDQVYLKAWKEIVEPIARQYRPQFILVSAGLDCHYADPIGRLSLSTLCYDKIFDSIVKIASETCNGRLAMVLEGGYNLGYIGKIAVAAIAKMSGSKHKINAEFRPENTARDRGEMLVRNVKKVQRRYWSLD